MKSIGFALVCTSVMLNVGCSDPALISEEDNSQNVVEALATPIAHWTFDTCANNVVQNVASESTPRWGDASLLNGAQCGLGAFDNAGIFDGINDRAEVADDARLHFTNAMTISLWVKPTGTTAPQTILGKWYAPDSYLLWLSNGYYRFSVALDNGTYANVALPATANEYAEIQAQFDGQTIRLAVNKPTGLLEASAAAQGSLRQSSRPLTMGNHPSWNAFSGAIDEVKLYDTTNLNGSPGQGMCPRYTLSCPNVESCCDP